MFVELLLEVAKRQFSNHILCLFDWIIGPGEHIIQAETGDGRFINLGPCRSLRPWLRAASLRSRLEFCQFFQLLPNQVSPFLNRMLRIIPQVKGLVADFCLLMKQEFLHHMNGIAHKAQWFDDGLTSPGCTYQP